MTFPVYFVQFSACGCAEIDVDGSGTISMDELNQADDFVQNAFGAGTMMMEDELTLLDFVKFVACMRPPPAASNCTWTIPPFNLALSVPSTQYHECAGHSGWP